LENSRLYIKSFKKRIRVYVRSLHNLDDWDALECDWAIVNFINPPYSQNLKEAFIKKAYEQWINGKICIMLLPVSTSTKIFHKYIYPYAEIRFLKGRVKFEGVNTKGEFVTNKCGMHDSMLVIFK